jgi:tetratricopeptide (TPR) repeat protein
MTVPDKLLAVVVGRAPQHLFVTRQGVQFMSRALIRGFWLVALGLFTQQLLQAAEPVWELRGKVVAVGAEASRLVELRLPEGLTVRVPLGAFSAASQAAILSSVDGKKPMAKEEAEGSPLASIEESVAQCKTAEDALKALQLCLAGDSGGVPPADAAAAVERWEARAQRGEVRLGKEWVSPAVAAEAQEAGAELLKKLATMASLGNLKLMRNDLEKASRADPNSGRADFLLGMATAFGIGMRPDSDKATKFFAEVVEREPGNGEAWNNLAVCEVRAGRFDDALAHFAKAAACLENPQVVIANVGGMVGYGRLSTKQAEAFTALYAQLAPAPSALPRAPMPQSGPALLSPFGQPLTGQPNFSDLFGTPAAPTERTGGGTVVAPSMVLVPADLPFPGGSLMVRSAAEPNVDRPAQLVATSQGLGLALLRCDGLATQPIPLAATVAAVGSEVMVVLPAGRPRGAAGPGNVVALAALPGSFVYSTNGANDVVGAPLVDAGGRVVGLTGATPLFPQPAVPRAFGTPIERIWPFLNDHLRDLKPSGPPEAAKAWEKIVNESLRHLVTVISRPGP